MPIGEIKTVVQKRGYAPTVEKKTVATKGGCAPTVEKKTVAENGGCAPTVEKKAVPKNGADDRKPPKGHHVSARVIELFCRFKERTFWVHRKQSRAPGSLLQ